MRIDITADAAGFLDRAQSLLRRDPLRHTVIATAATNRINGRAGDMSTHFVSITDSAGEIVGFAQCTDGAVYLGELPADILSSLIEAFAAQRITLRSVEGDAADAEAFAANWSKINDGTYRETFSARLFRLGDLLVPDAAGIPRLATVDDVSLCRTMIEEFSAESGAPHRLDEKAVRRRIEAGALWLWDRDGTPVTLVARHPVVMGWARIGPVYTPPRHRGNGYASALTATVAGRIRDEGAGACLFTDLANPTSNKIYQRIGFEQVRDFVNYGLTSGLS
ncbi:GNAT family N-acetyltransferase [Nocardia sp. NPDC058640]|uniref:GNAT family N-acetyltransferase n=1 Tax=Nocardia sp. NPDC058640 TaxID=3346571 RepID=UPI003669E8EE